MNRLLPELHARLGRKLLERQAKDFLESRGGVGPHLVDRERPAELPRHRREGRVLEPTGRDPIRERGRVEIDVEGIAMRRHPARDVNPDGTDLLRWALEPNAGQSLEAGRGEVERTKGADHRLLEVPAVPPHVASMAVKVENRVADEL